MAAAIVYEGVNGKYEGTLFNGVKFWVSQRVPLRSSIVAKIKDNGGKEVLLEKHADVLIADRLHKRHAPANSVSWEYIVRSVDQGALVNIEEHRIHPAAAPRPVASSRQTRVPFTQLDKQILLTWVRRAPGGPIGNKIYKDLEKLYPHHTWHSWRDKWLRNMSLLSEDQLPEILQELPLSRAQQASSVQSTPAATTAPSTKPAPPTISRPPATPAPSATPARVNQLHRAAAEVDPERTRTRVPFTEEDDRLLTKHVKKCVRKGMRARGNKIYTDLVKQHPHHTYQSWRDRWVRHLSERPSQNSSDDSESEVEAVEPQPKPTPTAPPPRPNNQRRPQAPPAMPPPPTPAPSASPAVNGQRMSRLQELTYKRDRIRATRLLQRIWRGVLVRRDIQRIAAFQVKAQGALVRRALDPTEIKPEPEETAWFTAAEKVPAREDPLLPPEEPETVLGEEDVERTPRPGDRLVVSRTDAAAAVIPPNEQFWRDFNMYNDVNGIMPSPWAQIGHSTVDFWDLWRHATAQPYHPSRDWEAIAEDLGFNWIAEPHVPAQLKVAFERNLLEFESSMREFDREEEEEEEEEEGDEEEEEAEEVGGEEVEGGEAHEEVGEEEFGVAGAVVVASQTTDANFTSSPPVLGLKRARRSSGYSPVRKRPRYDLSSEIPETPETRNGRTRQRTAEARVTAANQATPTRRPRLSHPAQRASEGQGQGIQHPAQPDGAEDDEVLSPSQQILSEIGAVSPAQRPSQKLPGVTSSGKKLVPSIEHDDEETELSDGFESLDNLPVPKASRTPHRPLKSRHRTLPWAKAKDKGKQPATTAATPLRPPTATATTTRAIPSSSRTPAHSNTGTHPTPSTARPKTTLNPSQLISHFTAQGYPLDLVSRALKATTWRAENMEPVLESLRRGRGVPEGVKGVWTDEDDERLRGIAGWIDRLGGKLPRHGRSGGEGDRGVFWGLVGKHGGSGGSGVLGRREFLKSWDRA